MDFAPKTVVNITTHNQYDSPTTLSPKDVLPSPLDQFREWLKAALENPAVLEPEAVSLSTATPSGIPSSRIVLLKRVDDKGFVFYTNYTSRKSAELKANPHAALAFHWKEVHRQVRVVGRAEMVERENSEAYFKSRPVGSRIGAWASRQSTVVEENEVQDRYAKLEERFGAKGSEGEPDIPLPEFWGGWRIIPEEVEFWAGKPSRLHDRVRYTRLSSDPSINSEGQWKIERLAP